MVGLSGNSMRSHGLAAMGMPGGKQGGAEPVLGSRSCLQVRWNHYWDPVNSMYEYIPDALFMNAESHFCERGKKTTT